jgi:hypothetical protein
MAGRRERVHAAWNAIAGLDGRVPAAWNAIADGREEDSDRWDEIADSARMCSARWMQISASREPGPTCREVIAAGTDAISAGRYCVSAVPVVIAPRPKWRLDDRRFLRARDEPLVRDADRLQLLLEACRRSAPMDLVDVPEQRRVVAQRGERLE